MVIDTSALLAIFRGEPDAEAHAACIADADSRKMSAATLVETSVVLRGARFALTDAEDWLDRFVERQEIDIEPVTLTQAAIAREAYRRFGKGMGHPAQLNFGDCFAYALAVALDAPLLCKGDDFSRTDLRTLP